MESVVAQLLTEMDGIEDNDGVIIIASTNRPDLIDPALLRKGRIDRIVYIGEPDEQSREKILSVHVKRTNIGEDIDVDALIRMLAKGTVEFSGADLEALVMEAGMNALRNDSDHVAVDDFKVALDAVAKERARNSEVEIVAKAKEPSFYQ